MKTPTKLISLLMLLALSGCLKSTDPKVPDAPEETRKPKVEDGSTPLPVETGSEGLGVTGNGNSQVLTPAAGGAAGEADEAYGKLRADGLAILQKCGECHSSATKGIEPFLTSPEFSEAALGTLADEILRQVSSKKMPTRRAVWKMSDEERATLLAFVEAWKKKQAEPVKPEEPIKTAEPAKPEEPVKPAEPAKPEEPVKPAEPAKPEEPNTPAVPMNPEEPASDPAADYAKLKTDGLALLQKCGECHSSASKGIEPLFTAPEFNEAQLAKLADKIAELVSSKKMPTRRAVWKMTDEERVTLLSFLDAWKKKNHEEPTRPTEPVKPEEPTSPTEPVKPEVPTQPSEPVKPEVPTQPTAPLDPEAAYAALKADGLALLNKCAACHNTASGKEPILSTPAFEETQLAKIGEALATRVSNGSMPPRRSPWKMTDEERATLLTFLDAWKKKNPQTPVVNPETPALPAGDVSPEEFLRLETSVKASLKVSCGACHKPGRATPALDNEDAFLTAVLAQPNTLLEKLETKTMPPPTSPRKISDEQRADFIQYLKVMKVRNKLPDTDPEAAE